jgi:phosphoglycolate phosphatase
MTLSARLAVFDVDGTLIDSQHNIVAAMTQAFRGQALDDPQPTKVRRIIGLSLMDAVAELLPEAELALHVAVAQGYKDAFLTLRQQADHSEPLFPGVVAALTSLAADGWLLGIATGKSRRGLDAMVVRHGLEGVFVTRQTADDNPGKPHPGMVLRALAETGVEAENAVMIGDTSFDMLMGRNALVHTIGVTWGYHAPSELLAAGAHRLVGEFGELHAALSATMEGSAECACRLS